MEALRAKWTQRARETLPKLLEQFDWIENRLETASETSPLTMNEYLDTLNRHNEYVSTFACFLDSQRQEYQHATGRHTELLTYLLERLPELHALPYSWLKCQFQACQLDHTIRVQFELMKKQCTRIYMLMALNMEHLIKVADKTSSSPHMY